MSWRNWVAGLLGVSILATAVSVVWVKHESRKLFATLQRLERTRDDLNVEWGQLQLEQSTWATDGRIETLVRKQLQMDLPRADEIVVVTP